MKKIADRLWGDCDGKQVKEHRLGAGRVVWGQTPAEVLAGMKIMPDFEPTLGNSPVRYIHRHMDEGTEIYFVANKTDKPQQLECRFRVAGKRPELWWPESGRTEFASHCGPLAGQTTMRLWLGPAESVFVVFRSPWGSFDPPTMDWAWGGDLIWEEPGYRIWADEKTWFVEAWNNTSYGVSVKSGRTFHCTVDDSACAAS